MIVSTFRGINSPVVLSNVQYTTVLNFIKNPSKQHLRKIQDFRKTGKEEMKLNIPVVTWAGMFSYRNKNSIEKFSNFIYVDFDDFEEVTIEETFEKIKKLSFIRAVWRSVSNNGLGCIIECENLDKEHFLPTYTHILSEFDIQPDILNDYSRCNVISYDLDIYVNFNSKLYPRKEKAINIRTIEQDISHIKYDVTKNDMFNTNGLFSNTPEHGLSIALQSAFKNKGLFIKGNRTNFTVSFAGLCKKLGIPEYDVIDFLTKNGYIYEDTDKTVKYIFKKY